MRQIITTQLFSLLCLVGCASVDPEPAGPVEPVGPSQPESPTGPTLRQQQMQACPEARTGRFVVLADFESGGSEAFVVQPPGAGRASIQIGQARTGHGSLESVLWGQAELAYQPTDPIDLGEATLLGLSIRCPALRDDLVVRLTGGGATWTSPPVLLRPGWNAVLIDLQRARQTEGFDPSGVREIRLGLTGGMRELALGVDDLLLIDNRRAIEPVPAGLTVRRVGLAAVVTLPGRDGRVRIAPGPDGLWRMGVHQPTVKFAAPSEPLPPGGEGLAILGDRRIGRLDILETNAVRCRLGMTWFFPARAGSWATIHAVRRVRWEMTFYGDGRWVTHLRLNNAGGTPIGKVLLALPGRRAAWAGGRLQRIWRDERFVGPIGRWSYLLPPSTGEQQRIAANYLDPPTVELLLGRQGVFAPGDVDRDGFDESQGCYVLAGHRGHCRFRVPAGEGGVVRPVFRVIGPWAGPVSVNVQGRAIRTQARLEDGSVLFALPDVFRRDVFVELFGSMAVEDESDGSPDRDR